MSSDIYDSVSPENVVSCPSPQQQPACSAVLVDNDVVVADGGRRHRLRSAGVFHDAEVSRLQKLRSRGDFSGIAAVWCFLPHT
eukprot:COSAG01_NODE_3870_length_5605_cov_4.345260_2_plen_83_part_00